MLDALISPDYAALNSELHEREAKYGAGAWRKADAILEAIQERGHQTVLDYGCGKGTLKQVLPGVEVREYDPAIPGKDTPPEPADMVCCLDVLEHVEPERLDAVIADLARLCRGEAFLTIATRPSTQTLADGRNAHLIVEPFDWWRERLTAHFLILSEIGDAGETWVRCVPVGDVGRIRAKMALSQDERNGFVRANCAREPRRILDRGPLPEHDRKAILVCFGPSLHDSLPELMPEIGAADIFTVSAAHGFLVNIGIIPYAHLDCDPRPHKVTQMGPAHPEVRYWLASCVHPSYLDHVAGGLETRLWHAYNADESRQFLNREIDPAAHMVIGGGSIGLRALALLYGLGYRRFDIHGMDCSFRGEQHYAGEHHGKRKDAVTVRTVDGREFETSPALILYFRYFFKQMLWMHGADVHLCGDGMLQHAVRSSQGK